MSRKMIMMLIVFLAIILFCSCGYVEIECSIDQDNLVYMGIKINMSTDGVDESDMLLINDILDDVEEHSQNNEYSYERIDFKDNTAIVIYMSKQTDNIEEAYAVMNAFMISEISPFSSVASGYSPSFFTDKLYYDVKLDFGNIPDIELIRNLSNEQKAKITEAMSSVTGKVIFNFPGNVMEYKGEINDGVVSEDFSLNDKAEILIASNILNNSNMTEYSTMATQVLQQKSSISRLTLIISGAFLVAIALVITFIISIPKHRKQK